MKINKIILNLILVTTLFACKKDEPTPDVTAELKQQVVTQYAEIVYQSYLDSYNTAVALQTSINAFLADPTAEKFANAKTAWETSRAPYGQTEVYRFYGGPIDNSDDNVEAELNSWPMDESYVDYVYGNTVAGIINMPNEYPDLSDSVLKNLNAKYGETDITTGYHAIEFLLWGQDLTLNGCANPRGCPNTSGPGQRPYTDYLPSTLGGTAMYPERRAQYLQAVTNILVEDLAYLVEAWNPNSTSNYRAQFTSTSNTDNSLALIMTGLATCTKAELGGQRISVPFATKDQEDEHDCFSDYTTYDVSNWVLGLENVFYGRYKKLDGTTISSKGLADLIKIKDNTLYTSTDSLVAATVTSASKIPYPFDNAITAGDANIKQTYVNLDTFGDKVVVIAKELGLTITNTTDVQ